MPNIIIDNFTFAYAGSQNPVLCSIDLKIAKGEFVLIAGASGCGKSTLALALAGLIPSRISGYFEGAVYFDGQKLAEMPIHEISQRIGMVFQNPDNQLIQLDVESEVAFGPENLCLPAEEIEKRVREALSLTKMENFRKRELFSLSGGQKQRVTIAAMLAMKPQILILDEPTSDLDPVGTQEVLRVLKELNEIHGMTIILVEHKIDEVIPWVDRVLLMDEGKIVQDCSPRQAFNNLELWDSLGVSVPEIVQLASALPEVFPDIIPLSVEEANSALRETSYARSLIGNDGSYFLKEDLSKSVLSWDNVSLAYDEVQVLHNVNLQIASGEWVALIGANGSGKTSLASLAMGFQEPTEGVVSCMNKSVNAGDISKQAGKIAYLFQAADNMLFGSTVEKEIQFGFSHRRKGIPEMKHTIEELLKLVDLGEYRHMNPFQLSHGQRKRLALGTLLALSPEVLILDEPTTGQDQGHAKRFLDFLQQLRGRFGLTYLMITHDMGAVANYASRVTALYNGKVILSGRPDMVFACRDKLRTCGIVPPPIANLHTCLTDGKAKRVCLTVDQFLSFIKAKEVVSFA